jgi:hypothetical protein
MPGLCGELRGHSPPNKPLERRHSFSSWPHGVLPVTAWRFGRSTRTSPEPLSSPSGAEQLGDHSIVRQNTGRAGVSVPSAESKGSLTGHWNSGPGRGAKDPRDRQYR